MTLIIIGGKRKKGLPINFIYQQLKCQKSWCMYVQRTELQCIQLLSDQYSSRISIYTQIRVTSLNTGRCGPGNKGVLLALYVVGSGILVVYRDSKFQPHYQRLEQSYQVLRSRYRQFQLKATMLYCLVDQQRELSPNKFKLKFVVRWTSQRLISSIVCCL